MFEVYSLFGFDFHKVKSIFISILLRYLLVCDNETHAIRSWLHPDVTNINWCPDHFDNAVSSKSCWLYKLFKHDFSTESYYILTYPSGKDLY